MMPLEQGVILNQDRMTLTLEGCIALDFNPAGTIKKTKTSIAKGNCS
jgi:hypothetical protein